MKQGLDMDNDGFCCNCATTREEVLKSIRVFNCFLQRQQQQQILTCQPKENRNRSNNNHEAEAAVSSEAVHQLARSYPFPKSHCFSCCLSISRIPNINNCHNFDSHSDTKCVDMQMDDIVSLFECADISVASPSAGGLHTRMLSGTHSISLTADNEMDFGKDQKPLICAGMRSRMGSSLSSDSDAEAEGQSLHSFSTGPPNNSHGDSHSYSQDVSSSLYWSRGTGLDDDHDYNYEDHRQLEGILRVRTEKEEKEKQKEKKQFESSVSASKPTENGESERTPKRAHPSDFNIRHRYCSSSSFSCYTSWYRAMMRDQPGGNSGVVGSGSGSAHSASSGYSSFAGGIHILDQPDSAKTQDPDHPLTALEMKKVTPCTGETGTLSSSNCTDESCSNLPQLYTLSWPIKHRHHLCNTMTSRLTCNIFPFSPIPVRGIRRMSLARLRRDNINNNKSSKNNNNNNNNSNSSGAGTIRNGGRGKGGGGDIGREREDSMTSAGGPGISGIGDAFSRQRSSICSVCSNDQISFVTRYLQKSFFAFVADETCYGHVEAHVVIDNLDQTQDGTSPQGDNLNDTATANKNGSLGESSSGGGLGETHKKKKRGFKSLVEGEEAEEESCEELCAAILKCLRILGIAALSIVVTCIIVFYFRPHK